MYARNAYCPRGKFPTYKYLMCLMASSKVKNNEYVLFFSNFCNYSKDIVSMITRKNIRSAFVFVCVDTVRPIPPFVDRVPLISSITTKQIYADDNITSLIDSITRAMYPPTSIEATPAFGMDQCDSEFECLDQGDNSTSFCMLDMDQFRITCIAEDDDVKSKRADSSQLEHYIAQRDKEININADRPNLF